MRPFAPTAGSGNFGTPWARTHRENLSACSRSVASCCGVLAAGRSLRHSCSARLNRRELGSSPTFRPFAVWPPSLIRPWLSGSGKVGTPFSRMQAEKAAGSALPEPPDELDVFVPVVFAPSCATPAPDEPPPQPAASNAEVAAATARAAIGTLLPLQRLRGGRCAVVGFTSVTPCLTRRKLTGRWIALGRLQQGNRSCYLAVTGAIRREARRRSRGLVGVTLQEAAPPWSRATLLSGVEESQAVARRRTVVPILIAVKRRLRFGRQARRSTRHATGLPSRRRSPRPAARPRPG
jgi:hypothetical protein